MNIAISYLDNLGIPRCGCPDLNLSAGNTKKWSINHLTYCVVRRDEDLDPETWDKILCQAFDSWSKVTDLSFQQITTQNGANILIDVGSGPSSHFDGPLGTLAWAYLPPTGNYNGQLLMKFDTEELWAKSGDEGTLLLNVASHEIGHLLGLDHSSVDTALMAPYYSASVFCPQDNDDISRIQSLYGKKKC